ncbi:MAG: hypothetical protein AAFX04_14385 [Pseudomonadota bacterium]
MNAQTTEDPIILTGVVREQGVPYEPIGDVEGFRQSISFVAWREGDGPVSTSLLQVQLNVDSREEQQALQQPFRKGRLVRFVIEDEVIFRMVDGVPLSAEADWVRMLEPVEDPELAAAADRIFNPLPFTDAELGEFEPHSRLFDHFGQVRQWLGKDIIFELILEPMGPDARDRALAMAHLAWNDHAAIDEKIREAITDHIYARRAEEAGIQLVPLDGGEPITEDELPPLSRKAFKADHRLRRVSCSALDYCVLEYLADTLEWHWSYTATIMRDDGGGWYLDGWDFP